MMHKIGIIGYGTMGSWHAASIRKRIPNLEVAYIFDINPEKLEKARAEGFNTLDTAEQLLASDIDLVLVATPNNFHKQYAVAALDAGKNVVCEKPVCLNLDELSEIFEAADRSKKVFTVHFNRRWDVDFDAVKNILDKKLVGKPYQVYSRLFSNRNIPGDWRTRKLSGGGFLYDFGIHMVDQILCLFGMPKSVHADLKHIYQQDVDDGFRLDLKYNDNLSVHIVGDSWTFVEENRWHISGDDGTAVIPNWQHTDGKIIRANVKKVDWTQGCVYTENGLSRTMWPRPEKEISEVPIPVSEKAPNWEGFYTNVLAAIEGSEEPLVSRRDIVNSLSVIMAAFESAENGSVVLTEKFTGRFE